MSTIKHIGLNHHRGGPAGRTSHGCPGRFIWDPLLKPSMLSWRGTGMYCKRRARAGCTVCTQDVKQPKHAQGISIAA